MPSKQRGPLGARAYWLGVTLVLIVGSALLATLDESGAPQEVLSVAGSQRGIEELVCPAASVETAVAKIEDELKLFDHAQYRLVASFRRSQQAAYIGSETRTLRRWSGPPDIETGPFQDEQRERLLLWMEERADSLEEDAVPQCIEASLEALVRAMRQQVSALRDAALRSEPEIEERLRDPVYQDMNRIAADGAAALDRLRALQLEAVGRGAGR